MKKTTAGLTFAAVTGFGLLTAGPALAAEPAISYPPPYVNCTEAEMEGVVNIPLGHPRYSPELDSDGDGIGCEDPTKPITPIPPDPYAPTPLDGKGRIPQVDQMPAGGANTGITQEPEESNAGILALGGGLVLATAAGGTYVVRRRRAAD